MKQSTLTLLAALVLALTGCVVTAVYPFYTPKDVVFEPQLLGKWETAHPEIGNQTNHWLFEKEGATTYRITEGKGGNDVVVYAATLFALGKDRFLDLLQTKPQPDGIYVAPHIILRVVEIGPSLKLAAMDYDWLKRILAKEPSVIRHTRMWEGNDQLIVLTADTKELQRFLRKHLKDEDTWSNLSEMKRENPSK